MKFRGYIGALAILPALVVFAQAGETKYASGTTSAAVTFAPAAGVRTVESVYATTDKENGAVKFYVWNQVAKYSPTVAQSVATSIVYVANSANTLTTNDAIVVVHASGAADYRTVSANTTTNMTLSSNLSAALTTAGKIYELTQGGEIVVGFDGAATGTNDTLVTSGNVFCTPGGSPLYVVLDGTGTAKLQVTVD